MGETIISSSVDKINFLFRMFDNFFFQSENISRRCVVHCVSRNVDFTAVLEMRMRTELLYLFVHFCSIFVQFITVLTFQALVFRRPQKQPQGHVKVN